jgi:hypothetical protein
VGERAIRPKEYVTGFCAAASMNMKQLGSTEGTPFESFGLPVGETAAQPQIYFGIARTGIFQTRTTSSIWLFAGAAAHDSSHCVGKAVSGRS